MITYQEYRKLYRKFMNRLMKYLFWPLAAVIMIGLALNGPIGIAVDMGLVLIFMVSYYYGRKARR